MAKPRWQIQAELRERKRNGLGNIHIQCDEIIKLLVEDLTFGRNSETYASRLKDPRVQALFAALGPLYATFRVWNADDRCWESLSLTALNRPHDG
jgi:hypothetical protein